MLSIDSNIKMWNNHGPQQKKRMSWPDTWDCFLKYKTDFQTNRKRVIRLPRENCVNWTKVEDSLMYLPYFSYLRVIMKVPKNSRLKLRRWAEMMKHKRLSSEALKERKDLRAILKNHLWISQTNRRNLESKHVTKGNESYFVTHSSVATFN